MLPATPPSPSKCSRHLPNQLNAASLHRDCYELEPRRRLLPCYTLHQSAGDGQQIGIQVPGPPLWRLLTVNQLQVLRPYLQR